MNLKAIILPPKRWQTHEDVKYDPIRTNLWFHRIAERKWQIPRLQYAYNEFLQVGAHLSRERIAANWGVNSRELRDFIAFKDGKSRLAGADVDYQRVSQQALDSSYIDYCHEFGTKSWRECLKDTAPRFAIHWRGLTEYWEIDPAFYPTNYKFK